MPTNIAIDDQLIEEAQRIGKHRTRRAVAIDFQISKMIKISKISDNYCQ